MDEPPRIARYAEWKSPLAPADMAARAVRLSAPKWGSGGSAFWLEGRAAEGGRVVLVEYAPSGAPRDWTPSGFNVRSRVHEYGGGEYWLSAGPDGSTVAWFTDFATQRVFRQDGPSGVPVPVTPDVGTSHRYADGSVVGGGAWIVAVRERHEGPSSTEVVNEVVAFPSDGSAPPHVIAGGDSPVAPSDFVASPTVSPDGLHVAWVAWDHPDMPWDATTLWVAPFNAATATINGPPVAMIDHVRDGGGRASLLHPAWAPDGALHCLTDASGWWNLARAGDGGTLEAVTPVEADLCAPFWTFSPAPYAFLPDGSVLVAPRRGGNATLATVPSGGGAPVPVDIGGHFGGSSPCVTGSRVLAVLASPTCAPRVAVIDLAGATAAPAVLREADAAIGQADVSGGEPITFAIDGGATSHATWYAPRNHRFVGPSGDLPPLIVLSHGGPTGATSRAYSQGVQFWTTRGFAVVDVDYRGSTGYGRAYREALNGAWGVADVDDCVAAARHLADTGRVDAARMAIMGGSAGGYTTLACLAFRPGAFAAGLSDYGIGDLEALAADTHKFESRYLDRLVAPYPSGADAYRARSPLHHVDRIETPMLILQGEDDRVVPPDQARAMATALERNGVAHAMVVYPGEGHGFRAAATITHAYGTKLAFLGQVLGFVPAGDVTPVEVRHRRR